MRSSEHYNKAIKCLQERYDRPRQIYQMHVRRIVEATPLKDGTGKEIHILQDLVVQHLRALKSLCHKPSQAFITSLLEMKLNSTTMFKWQRHSQGHTDISDYQELHYFSIYELKQPKHLLRSNVSRNRSIPWSLVQHPLTIAYL